MKHSNLQVSEIIGRGDPADKRDDPLVSFFCNGRGEKIWTSDPLNPIQVRYQTALRPDARNTV